MRIAAIRSIINFIAAVTVVVFKHSPDAPPATGWPSTRSHSTSAPRGCPWWRFLVPVPQSFVVDGSRFSLRTYTTNAGQTPTSMTPRRVNCFPGESPGMAGRYREDSYAVRMSCGAETMSNPTPPVHRVPRDLWAFRSARIPGSGQTWMHHSELMTMKQSRPYFGTRPAASVGRHRAVGRDA